MKRFSCATEGWCSLHASRSSKTKRPSFINAFARWKARSFSFTAIFHLSFLKRDAVARVAIKRRTERSPALRLRPIERSARAARTRYRFISHSLSACRPQRSELEAVEGLDHAVGRRDGVCPRHFCRAVPWLAASDVGSRRQPGTRPTRRAFGARLRATAVKARPAAGRSRVGVPPARRQTLRPPPPHAGSRTPRTHAGVRRCRFSPPRARPRA